MRYFYGKHKADGSWGFCVVPDNMEDEIHSEFTEISKEYYDSLFEEQSKGMEIHNKDGYPVAEPHIATEEEKAASVRAVRDMYLQESDIQMLPDNYAKLSDEEKENWAAYRQYLRDVPQSENFPNEKVLTFDEFMSQ